jgi:hypothetical protein
VSLTERLKAGETVTICPVHGEGCTAVHAEEERAIQTVTVKSADEIRGLALDALALPEGFDSLNIVIVMSGGEIEKHGREKLAHAATLGALAAIDELDETEGGVGYHSREPEKTDPSPALNT